MKFKIGDRVIINEDIKGANLSSKAYYKGVIIGIKEDAIWPYLVESYGGMGKHEEYFNDKDITLDIKEIRNDKLNQIGI